MFYVLAQTTPSMDPISGGAGWLGSGLLGTVLLWLLLKHIPEKDRQFKSFIEQKDLQLKDLLDAKDQQIRDLIATRDQLAKELDSRHAEDLREARKEYTASLRLSTETFRSEAMAERTACEKHFGTLADAMAKGNESTMSAFRTMAEQVQSHAERNRQWSNLLVAEVEKRTNAIGGGRHQGTGMRKPVSAKVTYVERN